MSNFDVDEAVDQLNQKLRGVNITNTIVVRQLAEEIANSIFSESDFESPSKYQDAIEKTKKQILRAAGFVQLV